MAKRSRASTASSGTDPQDASSSLRDPSIEPAGHTPKYVSLDEPVEKITMHCSFPPHPPLRFATYGEFDIHYQQEHTNRCVDCRSNFPSAHFLYLHIAENHDPLLASKREAGERTYGCFVESCDKVCRDWKKRRSHLVDKHGYPKNYDYFIVNTGVDGRKSMLRPGIDADGHRKSSRDRGEASDLSTVGSRTNHGASLDRHNDESAPAPKDNGPDPSTAKQSGDLKSRTSTKDTDMEDLAGSMSSLRMVPRSITFGKRKARAGLAKR